MSSTWNSPFDTPSDAQIQTSHAPLTLPCHSCGATLTYEPGAYDLECPHCGSITEIEGKDLELDDKADLKPELSQTETLSPAPLAMSCQTCGAHSEMEPQTFADSCRYCGSVMIAPLAGLRSYEPQGMLPFGVNQQQAQGRIKKWLKSHWFAPNALAKLAKADERLKGLYVPFWTFDADTQTSYRGQRGTQHRRTRTVTVMVDGKPKRQTRVETYMTWSNVSGCVARYFGDVLVRADGGLEELQDRAFSNWDLAALESYKPDYLAGYQARLYGRPLQAGWHDAEAIMERQIRRDIKRDIGGDDQRINAMNVESDEEAFGLVLLPIWLSKYDYRGKTYTVAVNGRTGEVRGKRPLAYWKIGLAALAALALIAGGIALFASLEGANPGPAYLSFD